MTTEIDLKHSSLREKIIGAFYDVYNELGYGLLESVYEEALSIALQEAGLRVQRQVPIAVWFHGQDVGDFRADLLVEGTVLLELKASRTLDKAREAQLLHYLRATEIEVGLLLNFGENRIFAVSCLTMKERKSVPIRVNPWLISPHENWIRLGLPRI